MLIGIDASRAVASERTGTETYSLHLVRALLAAESDHRWRLYFNQAPSPGLFPRDERVEWRVMPFPRLWTHLRLGWDVYRRPPAVLFVPAHVLPLWTATACVLTVHDLGYLAYPEAHTRWARRYLHWSTRHGVRSARRVIADSEATRRDLVRHYGADASRVTVAYPAGSNVERVTDLAQLKIVRERYDTGLCYFLYVGTLQPRKDLPTLVRAFTRLTLEGGIGPEARLVLAGRRGWLSEGTIEAVYASPAAERIVLPGYVPPEDLPALLSGALAFCFPSLYEGFGLPLVEAMTCGVPVISARAAALPEVVGDAGLLFAPRDEVALAEAMARVYADAALREEMAARGRARARRFSWERCARQVLAALEAAGAERPREARGGGRHAA